MKQIINELVKIIISYFISLILFIKFLPLSNMLGDNKTLLIMFALVSGVSYAIISYISYIILTKVIKIK